MSAKKRSKLVYVASPFRADTVRARRANERYAVSAMYDAYNEGVIPVAPHLLYPRFLADDDKVERALGLASGLAILRRCDELWVYAERGISAGMRGEIDAAKLWHIPVKVRGVEVRK